jgi:hypothetical protein
MIDQMIDYAWDLYGLQRSLVKLFEAARIAQSAHTCRLKTFQRNYVISVGRKAAMRIQCRALVASALKWLFRERHLPVRHRYGIRPLAL